MPNETERRLPAYRRADSPRAIATTDLNNVNMLVSGSIREVIGIFEWNESPDGAPIQSDSPRITSCPAILAGLSILRTGRQVNLVFARPAPFLFGPV